MPCIWEAEELDVEIPAQTLVLGSAGSQVPQELPRCSLMPAPTCRGQGEERESRPFQVGRWQVK